MRKICIVVLSLMVLSPVFALEVGDEPVVSVRVGELKTGPGFLARTVAQLEYGESVEVIEVASDWVKVRVRATGAEGWLHNTAVAGVREMQMDLSSTSSARTTTREIALAGRGFNEQVEARYKSDKGLDFTAVDEMEEYQVAVADLATFFDADRSPRVDVGDLRLLDYAGALVQRPRRKLFRVGEVADGVLDAPSGGGCGQRPLPFADSLQELIEGLLLSYEVGEDFAHGTLILPSS